MPHLRALVERTKDEPFTLLGLNAGDSKPDFRQGIEDFEVTWPCVFQGQEFAISKLYRVSGYPTILILDDQGRIRFRCLRGPALAEALDNLLAEAKSRRNREEGND